MRAVLDYFKTGITSLNFWKVASLWLICLLYVLFQGGKTSLMLFAMVTLLVAYWTVSGLGGIKRIKGTRTLSQTGDRSGILKAGEQVQVKLHVQPPRFLPLPYIVIREHLRRHNGDSWIFEDSIVPHFNHEGFLIYQTPPLERGRYVFASTECQSEDIFGLMKHKGGFQAGGEFRILPRTVFVPKWQLYSRNSRLAGPETAVSLSRRETTQINGVRDYMYGDRISRIHWNATAKTGSWKSKEFEHESLPKTILVVDAHSSSYQDPAQFELAVSTAASLIEYAIRERISMGMCTLGRPFRGFSPAEGLLERQQMLHHLVDIDAEGYGNHRDILEAKRDFFAPGAFFIFISPLVDERLLSVMHWARTRRMIPYHIYTGSPFQAPTREGGGRDNLHKHGFRGVSLSSLGELPVVLGGGQL